MAAFRKRWISARPEVAALPNHVSKSWWGRPIASEDARRDGSKMLLHIKGFGGGVPLNTETAAVNPRAGIEKITRRCLFFIEMARAGSAKASGPFTFAVVI